MTPCTPDGLARHLLTVLSQEVLKLGDEVHPEFQETLVLGVARMLGQLLAAKPGDSDERQVLFEAAINEIVRQVPWASVVVKAADEASEGFGDDDDG